MPNTVHTIVYKFAQNLKNILGESLVKVIVYGSYARGDFNEHSDVDIMILVSLDENEIRDKFNDVCDLAFEYEINYGLVISPLIKNEKHFNSWSETLPFYRNIVKEGVLIDGQ